MQTAPTIPAKLQFASNKKIDKQMRFHSVKKQRSKNRIRYAKPTREDHNNFFEELGIIILIILFINNNAVFIFIIRIIFGPQLQTKGTLQDRPHSADCPFLR